MSVRFFSFLIYPILIGFLDPIQLGYIALIDLIINILTIIICLGFDKVITQYSETWGEKSAFNTIKCIKIVCIVASIILCIFTIFISFIDIGKYEYLIYWGLLIAWPRAISLIGFSYFRISNFSKVASSLSFSQSILSTTLALIAIIFYSRTFYGFYTGIIISEIIISFIYVYKILKSNRLSSEYCERLNVINLLKFGTPLTFGEIFYNAIFSLDRLFIERYFGQEILGYYFLAFKISRIVTDINGSIKHAWIPLIMGAKNNIKNIQITIKNFWFKVIEFYFVLAILILVLLNFLLHEYKSGIYIKVLDYLPIFLFTAVINAVYVLLLPSYSINFKQLRLMLRNCIIFLLMIIGLYIIPNFSNNILAIQFFIFFINLLILLDSLLISTNVFKFKKINFKIILMAFLLFLASINILYAGNVLLINLIIFTYAFYYLINLFYKLMHAK